MPPRTTRRKIPPKTAGAQGQIGLTAEAREELRRNGVDERGSDDETGVPVYDPDGANAGWFADAAASSESIYLGATESSDGSGVSPGASPNLGGSDESAARFVAAPGAVIDAQIPPERPLVDPERKQNRGDESALKTTPPDKDEWLDFFSRVILKVGMESYLDFAFRGVDETVVDPADLKRINPTKELRDTISRPFAVYATKNKWTRKHGREIVALTDSLESAVTLGIWARRVNRIARKYKPRQAQRAKVTLNPRGGNDGDNGPDSGLGEGIDGQRNGRVPGGFHVYNPGSG